MTKLLNRSYLILLVLVATLSHYCTGQKETSSGIYHDFDAQDDLILNRLDLALLSKIRIDTRQVPENRCAIYVNELRRMIEDKEASTSSLSSDAELLNQVVRVLEKRKLPFGNSQPVLQDLLECLHPRTVGGLNVIDNESTSKREVIASPPNREPLTDLNSSGQKGIRRAMNEFNEVKNNIKDFGQDLYLKVGKNSDRYENRQVAASNDVVQENFQKPSWIDSSQKDDTVMDNSVLDDDSDDEPKLTLGANEIKPKKGFKLFRRNKGKPNPVKIDDPEEDSDSDSDSDSDDDDDDDHHHHHDHDHDDPSTSQKRFDLKNLRKKGSDVIPVIRKKVVDFYGFKKNPGDVKYEQLDDQGNPILQHDNLDDDRREEQIPGSNKVEIHYANDYHQQTSDDGTQFRHSNRNMNNYEHQTINRRLNDLKDAIKPNPSSVIIDDGLYGPEVRPLSHNHHMRHVDFEPEPALERARFETMKAQYEAASERERQYLAQLHSNKALIKKQERLIEELSGNEKFHEKFHEKELSDPEKMASIIWEKLDPDEDQLHRCYRYYLLFTYPKKVSKATVKTIANLNIRVPNIDSYNRQVLAAHSGLLQRTSDVLLRSAHKRAVKVGLDLQDCMSQSSQSGYQNNWQYQTDMRPESAFESNRPSSYSNRFSRIPAIPPIPPLPPMPPMRQFGHDVPNFQYY